MKAIIVLLLFLLINCSQNPLAPEAPVRHDFVSGNLSDDFSLLIKTTNYHDIGDGAEVEAIVGTENTITIKDSRYKSDREANPIIQIKYWENGFLFPDTERQMLIDFKEGETNVKVEIITNTSTIINFSVHGIKDNKPESVVVGNFPRGVISSDISMQEELVLMEKYIESEIDSAVGWLETTISRIATGFWFVNERGKKISENGVSKRMFEFINSNIDQLTYLKCIDWAHVSILYASVMNPDSVEAFYLRSIVESGHLKHADDNREALKLLKNRDYQEFNKLLSDILDHPFAYSDKDSLSYWLKKREEGYENDYWTMGYESLVDIAREFLSGL